jgi:hypothetical protein
MKPWWERPSVIAGCVGLFLFLTFMFASLRVASEEMANGTSAPAPVTTTYNGVKCYPQAGDLVCPGQAPTFPTHDLDNPQQP